MVSVSMLKRLTFALVDTINVRRTISKLLRWGHAQGLELASWRLAHGSRLIRCVGNNQRSGCQSSDGDSLIFLVGLYSANRMLALLARRENVSTVSTCRHGACCWIARHSLQLPCAAGSLRLGCDSYVAIS
jgi:hypothetical protein